MPRLAVRWSGVALALLGAMAWLVGLSATAATPAHRKSMLGEGGEASRMVFKAHTKPTSSPSCQLTLMHVYTSKYNKKHTQFVFTGSLVAKREKGKALLLSVVGQNHVLSASGQGFKPFALSRVELGLADVSARRFAERHSSCKKGHVCAAYKDNKKHELQAWVSDAHKSMHVLFPLVTKQSAVAIDLTQFPASAQAGNPPLAQFKQCTADLR